MTHHVEKTDLLQKEIENELNKKNGNGTPLPGNQIEPQQFYRITALHAAKTELEYCSTGEAIVHIHQCLAIARKENNPDLISGYEKAIKIILGDPA